MRKLEDCPQDPVHHAEGDVWIHTRMVLETLLAMPAFRALPPADRDAVYVACLMHDVAKPATTRVEDGRVTAKGHSRAGELMARRLLWELGAPFALREAVCSLIRYHQIPFFLVERDDAQRVAAEISLTARCDLLALVAEADIRGRICGDLGRILDQIESLPRDLPRGSASPARAGSPPITPASSTSDPTPAPAATPTSKPGTTPRPRSP